MRGMPYEDIKQIPNTYLRDVWYVLGNGLEGWYADGDRAYMQYQQLFSYSKETPKPIRDVFPVHHKMRNLGNLQPKNLAAKWMAIKPKRNKEKQ